jgi:hypothetical protein
MPAFVIDEDMPRSTGPALAARGYPVKDIRQKRRAVLLAGERSSGGA